MAVTLAEVAAHAGVSPATVSRVLNGGYPVAGGTRTRVEQAIESLGYIANGPARALAAATSDLVGVLVHDVADSFFGILAGSLQRALAPSGPGAARKLAVVCNTEGAPETELAYLALLEGQRAGGIVLTGGAVEEPEHTSALTARIARTAASGAPVVLCGRPPLPLPAHLPVATVMFDDHGGAFRLAQHLLALGHRRIASIAGPPGLSTTRERLDGHRTALRQHGHGVADSCAALTVHAGFERAAGYDATRELLRRGAPFTAVAAANDTVATGVVAALRDAGIRIPEDVSVAGFDDLPFCGDTAPALTTVRVPLREAGTLAAHLVTGRRPLPPGGITTLPTELMVRGSTAPPPDERSSP
ncbi:LacI family transcriptional regulator [Streptomyces subrutilus]|uniref:LacI family transcriptional regulator n=1 Tax=Streptomyces subrutilus TaxID=36818 RepID=A0A5P2UI37_9ACTN|nr:LacI family DNA-binding transcriptional regulator [Streptomyces subrutilus]QEU77441.1 LacI family transcriptional regulator [Streptomyces subrutilus]GGZ47466.1 LacI family transcriptional regulator [Streptomyces subrutilus]